MENLTTQTRRSTAAKAFSDDLLRPQDFTDVFGGPPRTILSHHLSAAGFFNDDIFWQTETDAPSPLKTAWSGRNLPLFEIPPAKQISSERCSRQRSSFFSDIFGWNSQKLMSSSSRSKTNSSSALSSEELSPLRPPISDDVSLLASKLRPINVKTIWNSARTAHEDHTKQQKWPSFQDPNSENEFVEKLWSRPSEFDRRNATAESVGLEQTYENDVQFNSPSSAVSSDRNLDTSEVVQEEMEVDDYYEDELMSSYVIELDSCNRETNFESNDVEEAIAWAKEKFQKHSSQEVVKEHQLSAQGPTSEIPDETSILDEKMRWWLIGKESDIRLQLSSLHHILWPNSGWTAIPLTNLIESSQVKKAYQKAVLCLHPDKLQQRGATPTHKHIAKKAFAALQDAWTTFVTLDASCR